MSMSKKKHKSVNTERRLSSLERRAIFELHFAAAIRAILRAVTSSSTLTTKAKARGVLKVWNSDQITEWHKEYLRFLLEASPDKEALELKINEIIKMAEGEVVRKRGGR